MFLKTKSIGATKISLSLVAAFASVAAGPVAAQTTITANVAFPRVHPMYTGVLAPWAVGVEKATKGRIKVNVPAASLAPFRRQWDMVVKGVADVAINPNAFQRNRLHLTQVVTLPFLLTNAEANSVSLWRVQKKYFDKIEEHKGTKLLAMIVHSGYHIQNRVRAINKVEDLHGLKIRTGAGNTQKLFVAIGGSPVSAPGTKLFEFVSKGTVDGMLSTVGSIQTYKIGRYIKYQTDIPGTLGSGSFSLVMRQQAWDALSTADKAAIESVSGEGLSRTGGRAWDDQDKKGVADIVKYKIQRQIATPELVNSIKAKVGFLNETWIEAAKKKGLANPQVAMDAYREEGRRIAGK